jgi:radical SAM protein with 4Fe4S-binding SPASM domain
VGIADIDFLGNVHPDQFWMHHTLGNVRERPFSEIWQDTSDELLAGLRDRAPLLKGRCGGCQWKDVCGGSFRVRADQMHGDPWAEDPGCYLTDEECGLVPGSRVREPSA